MALVAKLYPQEATHRRDARYRAEIEATMRDSSLSPIDIGIYDLSASGFCANLPQPRQVGEPLRVGISGIGVREARVVWRDGRRHGCAFIDPVEDAAVTSALDANTVVMGEFGTVPAGGARAAAIDDRYPGWIRLSLVIALPIAMWSGLVWLGRELLPT